MVLFSTGVSLWFRSPCEGFQFYSLCDGKGSFSVLFPLRWEGQFFSFIHFVMGRTVFQFYSLYDGEGSLVLFTFRWEGQFSLIYFTMGRAVLQF